MLRKLCVLAQYTFLEQVRSRLYLVIVFFGVIVLAASLLVGAMAPGFKTRVVFDLGLFALELFALLAALFGAVSVVSSDIETKTLYMLLSRPLPRWLFVSGRFVGMMGAVVAAMAVMSLLHIGIILSDRHWFSIFVEGWSFWTVYPMLVLMSFLKVLITASLALFFSLFSTSAVSSMVFTASFWALGHFGPEMMFLLQKNLSGAAKFFLQVFFFIVPNFQLLNFRDVFFAPGFSTAGFAAWSLLYSFGYAGVFLLLSFILFSKKEF